MRAGISRKLNDRRYLVSAVKIYRSARDADWLPAPRSSFCAPHARPSRLSAASATGAARNTFRRPGVGRECSQGTDPALRPPWTRPCAYQVPDFFCAKETQNHGAERPASVTEPTKTRPFHLFLAKSDCGRAVQRRVGALSTASERNDAHAERGCAAWAAVVGAAEQACGAGHLEHEGRVVGVATAAHAGAHAARSDALRQLRQRRGPARAQLRGRRSDARGCGRRSPERGGMPRAGPPPRRPHKSARQFARKSCPPCGDPPTS
jgi:hypothetical protein